MPNSIPANTARDAQGRLRKIDNILNKKVPRRFPGIRNVGVLNTLATLGKTFVMGGLPWRDMRRAIPFAAVLLLMSCGNPQEEAQREAALAQQLLDGGDLPGARNAITRAMALRDDQLEIVLLDARIKLRMQDLAAAREAFRTVLVFDPNNQEALTAVTQISVMYGDKKTAREMIDRAIALDPNNAEVLLSKGVLELDDKNFKAAIATADQLLINPSDPRGTVLKSRALFLSGERAASYALLRDSIASFGNNQLVAAALLENTRAEGNVPAMLEQFVFLGSAELNSPDLALDEINVRYKSGDSEGARLRGVDFLTRFGSDARQVRRLVELWEEYDPAPLTDADIQTLAQNGSVDARLAAARYLIDRGNADAGVPLLANAPDPRVFGMMARLQVLRGDRTGLVAAKRILEGDQGNCAALTAVAEWELANGAYEQAVIPAQVLATQCRDRTDGYDLLAAAYRKAQRPRAVERAFREGTEAHPQDSRLAADFADWLLANGRAQSAVSLTRRLTVRAPARVSSWQLRIDVCRRAGDRACVAQAEKGLAMARKVFALAAQPGTRRGDTLFGRTWQ